MRVLLTNDDGVAADGIHVLAETLTPAWDVAVVAPDSQRSASSHSITLHKPLRLDPVGRYPDGARAFQCSGSPTDCVMLGVMEVMKEAPPHVIVSGINDGPNVAEDVTYSGTVAAAMEGAMLKIPSLSVSLFEAKPPNFGPAAEYTARLISRLFERDASKRDAPSFAALMKRERVFLNVNVPGLPAEKVKGFAVTFLGSRTYKDVVNRMLDPRRRPYFWIGGEKVMDAGPRGSDIQALRRGYVSVTPLTVDITAASALPALTDALRGL
jgi:5'-nucleotidase